MRPWRERCVVFALSVSLRIQHSRYSTSMSSWNVGGCRAVILLSIGMVHTANNFLQWPYTYDTCDIGTVKNQTINNQPAAATVNGDTGHKGILSFLPGQRLSRCTCAGEAHPGPKHSDGTFVGRSAPEIDVFEAQIDQNTLIAGVSQSAQWAVSVSTASVVVYVGAYADEINRRRFVPQPFNHAYIWLNTTANEIIADPTISKQNTFTGSVTQQATSVVTDTDPNCYEYETGCYSIYGFEYQPGFEEGVRGYLSLWDDQALIVVCAVYHLDFEQQDFVDPERSGHGPR